MNNLSNIIENNNISYKQKSISKNGSLTIITGCMFSGKTTKLIQLYENINKYKKFNCLAIKYKLDNRYTDKSEIMTHDKLNIECLSCENFNELLFNTNYYNKFIKATHLFIDEAQFFENLLTWLLYFIKTHNKHIIISGLDYDYKKQPFGQINEAKSYANYIYQLKGKCNDCNNESIYTHRKIKSNELILIGSDEYIPVCNDCWNKYSNTK